MKRYVPLLLVVLIALAGALYYQATRGADDIVLTGIVTTDDVIVGSEVQGRLQQLLVKEGDWVEQGQLLGRIQPEEWRAEMAFYTDSEQQSAAQASLAMARSSADQTTARRAALDANRHRLAAAGAQKEKAKVLLGYTEIHAPIAGIVDVRAALQGEIVKSGQAIVTLIDRC